MGVSYNVAEAIFRAKELNLLRNNLGEIVTTIYLDQSRPFRFPSKNLSIPGQYIDPTTLSFLRHRSAKTPLQGRTHIFIHKDW